MPPLVREVIGDVLREARTTQGRTLREVSDSARVSLGYLSEVERCRKEPSSELLNAICDALDVPLSVGAHRRRRADGQRGTRGRRRAGRPQHRRQHQGRHPAGGQPGAGLSGGIPARGTAIGASPLN
ncbi:hypothetical protein MLM_1480 [Mycobacterium lepraemurium]|nr:hypothetical protein MLM_1480 [Mycobacterium lepraemurium]